MKKNLLIFFVGFMSTSCFAQDVLPDVSAPHKQLTQESVKSPVKDSQRGIRQTKAFVASKSNKNKVVVDSLLNKINNLLIINNKMLEQLDINMSLKNRYRLYPTENIYTFLQLDTKTGKIQQVQWSLDSDKEGSVTINDEDLSYGYGYGSGSFELYPTKNMFQFILLDKTDGRKWHVQWGMEFEKRWIRKILN